MFIVADLVSLRTFSNVAYREYAQCHGKCGMKNCVISFVPVDAHATEFWNYKYNQYKKLYIC